MRVILAQAMGLCFGVRDALALARGVDQPARVTIRGELVHNEIVLQELADRGFHMQTESGRGQAAPTEFIMITAHGISNRERRQLEESGKRLLDTTCPLVERVHDAALRLARDGRLVLIIGRPGHAEVMGILGDVDQAVVVSGPHDVRPYSAARLGVVCQSTTPPHVAEAALAAIRAANPAADIQFEDTICQPTRDRQQALLRILPEVDAVVVVGGRNSNNTAELARLCQQHNVSAYHVQCAADLDPRWFRNCRTVGLTAGTSTLDGTIAAVHRALLQLPGADDEPQAASAYREPPEASLAAPLISQPGGGRAGNE